MPQFTLAQIEQALDTGRMLVRAANGNLWTCRRNGRTQTWVTRPGEFRIPVKAGFRATCAITHTSLIGLRGCGTEAEFVIDAVLAPLVEATP